MNASEYEKLIFKCTYLFSLQRCAAGYERTVVFVVQPIGRLIPPVFDVIIYYSKINESRAQSHYREGAVPILFRCKNPPLCSQYSSCLVAVFRDLFRKVFGIFEFVLVADTLNEIHGHIVTYQISDIFN